MSTGGFFSSDLYTLYNVVQNTQILFPKELILSTLREYFAKDSKYHYVKDEWGFPKTPDHTDLPPNAGYNDDETTRIYIGQENRFDIPFYPAVLVRHSSSSFIPISFNEENECIQYGYRLYVDGYGQQYNLQVPLGFIFAGSWDLGFEIDVLTEGPQDRATIVEAICMLFRIMREPMTRSGLFIKDIKTTGESSELYQNDFIFKQTISLDCRGEYRRIIPVENIIEAITLCIEFGQIDNPASPPDPNLQINYSFDLTDAILQAQPI